MHRPNQADATAVAADHRSHRDLAVSLAGGIVGDLVPANGPPLLDRLPILPEHQRQGRLGNHLIDELSHHLALSQARRFRESRIDLDEAEAIVLDLQVEDYVGHAHVDQRPQAIALLRSRRASTLFSAPRAPLSEGVHLETIPPIFVSRRAKPAAPGGFGGTPKRFPRWGSWGLSGLVGSLGRAPLPTFPCGAGAGKIGRASCRERGWGAGADGASALHAGC